MIIVTLERIEGKRIVKTLGIARGSTTRAKHLGKDIVAGLRGIVGGEITEYTKLMAESREEAMERMVEQAKKMGANAIVGTRFMTAMVTMGAAEFLAYGTAVVVE